MAIQILQKETYLAMITNSIGSHQYRNLYADVDGTKRDIVEEGTISCAFFVSSILHHFNLIASPHATVDGLERDLNNSGWRLAEKPSAGDVIVWEEKSQATGLHAHIGFCTGERAVSHLDTSRSPEEHDLTFGGARAVKAIYTRVW